MTSTDPQLPGDIVEIQTVAMTPDKRASDGTETSTSPGSARSTSSSGIGSSSPSSPANAPSPGVSSAPSPGVPSASPLALVGALRAELEPLGFECHPLLIGWYNEQVSPGFRLPHPPDTLAVVVISTPDMFERCFIPHVRRVGQEPASRRDPLDTCMRHVIGQAARHVHESARVLHDFELGPTRRPRVLVQTAGHVSGAVRLYRRGELKENPWPEKGAMMGVCLHPKFGGWFALRAVVVLEGVEAPDLQQPQPPEILTTDQQKREVLEQFNWHWRDGRYREFGSPQHRYSALQQEYFLTPPGERQPIVERIARGELPCDGGVEALGEGKN
ncbi:Methylmalonic aciduria and homocystinuria type C [Amphibalanus amphitrite]|uniref:Cyanocobalamin reductase (cyanide-eliminating) n=1 Tax=Amphibalanus amphitrite TaxID=1232801 RepID=A0A6A4WZT6_AMPAM|nr:Methylmalonic aciduria and homocystinuria type C [Amphibalanus amphitrite]